MRDALNPNQNEYDEEYENENFNDIQYNQE